MYAHIHLFMSSYGLWWAIFHIKKASYVDKKTGSKLFCCCKTWNDLGVEEECEMGVTCMKISLSLSAAASMAPWDWRAQVPEELFWKPTSTKYCCTCCCLLVAQLTNTNAELCWNQFWYRKNLVRKLLIKREEFVVQLHSKHKKREKNINVCQGKSTTVLARKIHTFASFWVSIWAMEKKMN